MHARVYAYLAWKYYCLLFSCVSEESTYRIFVRPNPLGMLRKYLADWVPQAFADGA